MERVLNLVNPWWSTDVNHPLLQLLLPQPLVSPVGGSIICNTGNTGKSSESPKKGMPRGKYTVNSHT